MMSTHIVAPPIVGRACIGNAHSPAATRTGPVRRSSIESAIVLICAKNAAMRVAALVPRRPDRVIDPRVVGEQGDVGVLVALREGGAVGVDGGSDGGGISGHAAGPYS